MIIPHILLAGRGLASERQQALCGDAILKIAHEGARQFRQIHIGSI